MEGHRSITAPSSGRKYIIYIEEEKELPWGTVDESRRSINRDRGRGTDALSKAGRFSFVDKKP